MLWKQRRFISCGSAQFECNVSCVHIDHLMICDAEENIKADNEEVA